MTMSHTNFNYLMEQLDLMYGASVSGSNNGTICADGAINPLQNTCAVGFAGSDEIAKSLRSYATSAASNNESNVSAVDAIMKDFASNGYSSDLHRYQYRTSCAQTAPNSNRNASALASANSFLFYEGNVAIAINPQIYQQQMFVQQAQQQWMNLGANNNPWNCTNVAPAGGTNIPGVGMNKGSAGGNGNRGSRLEQNNVMGNQSTITRAQKRGASVKNLIKHCVFCENNNEPEAVVKSHSVRDSLGRVLCPKLRTYTCPICKASGDMAHTIKYCPQKPIVTMEDSLKAEEIRAAKTNYYKQQMKI